MEEEANTYQETHTLHLSKKSIFELSKDILKFIFPAEIATFFATLIAVLSVAEVVTKDIPDTSSIDYLIPSIIISLITASYKGITAYIKHIPAELESESESIQKTYKRQKLGWQYKIALEMITQRIDSHEKSIERISRGSEFIKPRRVDLEEYIAWSQERTTTIIRLMKSVTRQFVNELPRTISELDLKVKLSEFKIQIDYIGSLYKEIRDFEAESYQIVPPDELEDAHKLTHNWSSTLRIAGNQFLEYLHIIQTFDEKSIRKGTAKIPEISVTILPISFLDDYLKELAAGIEKHQCEQT